MSQGDHQQAFDAAIKLLLEEVYSRSASVIHDELWQDGDRYAQHVVTLASHWRDSQQ